MADILVTRPLMPPIEEYIDEIRSIWDNQWLTNMGQKHNELEKELCSYLDVPNVGLVVNGHAALELALQAYGINGEVITTPFTFVSTTNAICRVGATPVFCDICENDYTIDCEKIESLITPRTQAIMPVHVYGNVCNVEEIKRIADKYGLKVIYDAAHAFGIKYKGKSVADMGDASCYSFHATKVFNTIEGGAICTGDSELYKKICILRDFGIDSNDDTVELGGNAKMNEFSASMGICNLRHISEAICNRKIISEKYDEELSMISGICLNNKQKNVESNYSYYPIVIDPEKYGHTRDELVDELRKHSIYSRKYFYPIVSEMTIYKGSYTTDTPIAKKISERVMTLPIYAGLKMEEVKLISSIIREFSI